jgi:predicted kinase
VPSLVSIASTPARGVRKDAVVALPLLVVVTGMPSSGKTTVAEGLARQLRLPLIAKDEIKQSLYESLGADDVASSGRLGAAAYTLIFALARAMLASGVSAIVEANFFRDQEHEFAALPPHRLMQLHCEAPLTVLLERYANRSRHAGHHDAEKIKGLPERFESGAHSPLRLPGELIQLDTAQPVELDAVAGRIRTLL